MEQEPKRQKKDQSTKRKQVTSEMSQESTPMKVPSAGGPDDAPSPADNDDLRKLMDRMETAKQEIELLRKEINKLEDNQNALQWFNMSYWFGGNSTRINSKEQQIVQIQSQLAAQEKQRTALLEERREAQGAKRPRINGGLGEATKEGSNTAEEAQGKRPRDASKKGSNTAEEAPGYAWSVTRKHRNRAVHSRNGNMDYGVVVKVIIDEAPSFQTSDLNQSAERFYKTLKIAFPDADAILAPMAIEYIKNSDRPSPFMAIYEKKYEALISANNQEAQAAKRQKMDDGGAGDASDTRKQLNLEQLLPIRDIVLPLARSPPFTAEDGWLDRTLGIIENGYNAKDDIQLRVPPTALVRCSRGGKTRALQEIANALKSKGICVLFVSFNDYSSLDSRDKENPILALCERIAFEARRHRDHQTSVGKPFTSFKTNFTVTIAKVLQWLGANPCVLLIDELNNMPLSQVFADWLKEHFLITSGRYLVFSSHVVSTTDELSRYMDGSSPRNVEVISLPKIPSLKVAMENFNWRNLKAATALYYGLLPSLIYGASQDAHRREKFTFTHLPTTIRSIAIQDCIGPNGERITVGDLKKLFKTFITGSPVALGKSEESVLFPLLQLMSSSSSDRDGSHKTVIHWIPYHMVEVLRQFSTTQNLPRTFPFLNQFATLFENFAESKIKSGEGWENLFVAVVLIRCIAGLFDGTILPFESKGSISYQTNFKGDQKTKDLDTYLQGILDPGTYPHISVYYPDHAQFEAYDVIVVYFRAANDKEFYGYQLKEGTNLPERCARQGLKQGFKASFVIRGKTGKKEWQDRGWICPDDHALSHFFGESGRHWTPSRWEELETGEDVQDSA